MTTRIIEINGMKCEIDERAIRKIDTYRVGQAVRVLVTPVYGSPKICPGIVVSIDAFAKLPTMNVAYLPDGVLASGAQVAFVAINEKTEVAEVVPTANDDVLPTMESVRKYFDNEIDRKRRDIAEIESRRDLFMTQYGNALEAIKPPEAAAPAEL